LTDFVVLKVPNRFVFGDVGMIPQSLRQIVLVS